MPRTLSVFSSSTDSGVSGRVLLGMIRVVEHIKIDLFRFVVDDNHNLRDNPF